jgi:uncharacterized protein YdeI (BOF family)
MEESILLRVALALSIIGICALLLIMKLSGIDESSISQAKQLEEGTPVKITGTVERISAKEGFTIITLSAKEQIEAVAFKSINLSKGQRVQVTGKVKDYNGKNELVIDEILLR